MLFLFLRLIVYRFEILKIKVQRLEKIAGILGGLVEEDCHHH
jgi:hypothetical protein